MHPNESALTPRAAEIKRQKHKDKSVPVDGRPGAGPGGRWETEGRKGPCVGTEGRTWEAVEAISRRQMLRQ